MVSDALARSLGATAPEDLIGAPVPADLPASDETAILDGTGELVAFLGIVAERTQPAGRLHEIVATPARRGHRGARPRVDHGAALGSWLLRRAAPRSAAGAAS